MVAVTSHRKTRAVFAGDIAMYEDVPPFSRDVEDIAIANVLTEQLQNGTYRHDYDLIQGRKLARKGQKPAKSRKPVTKKPFDPQAQKEKIDKIIEGLNRHKGRRYKTAHENRQEKRQREQPLREQLWELEQSAKIRRWDDAKQKIVRTYNQGVSPAYLAYRWAVVEATFNLHIHSICIETKEGFVCDLVRSLVMLHADDKLMELVA